MVQQGDASRAGVYRLTRDAPISIDAFALSRPGKGWSRWYDRRAPPGRRPADREIAGYTSERMPPGLRTKCRLKSHLASERLDGGADTANAPSMTSRQVRPASA